MTPHAIPMEQYRRREVVRFVLTMLAEFAVFMLFMVGLFAVLIVAAFR